MEKLKKQRLIGYLKYSILVLILFSSSCKKDGEVVEPDPTPDNLVADVEIGDSDIPYLVIDTKGQAIENEPKIPAELRVFIEKKEVLNTNIGIEFRGSTSFRISDKKSFGLETWDVDGNDVDVAFFDFPKEEDWILTGHVVNLNSGFIIDRTLLYHYFGYELFRKMGRYASRTKFVELEINGDYQGVYVFMEKLKRDNNRIDIARLEPEDEDAEAINGGYILKIDKTTGGDLGIVEPLEYFATNWEDDARYTADISFRSPYDINGEELNFEPYRPPYHDQQYLETYFLYEYPDAADITEAQKNYIQNYITDFETALLTDDFSAATRTYTDYIDLNSFVDFFIINEVCRNVDGYRLSTYMHKDRNGKLAMGPIWDLNIGFDTGDRVPWDDWVMNYNNFVDQDAWMIPFWWPRLLDDPIFRQAVKDRWVALRAGALSTPQLLAMVDQRVTYLKGNGAIERNYSKWDADGNVDYDAAIQSLKSFLDTRTQWMDATIGSF